MTPEDNLILLQEIQDKMATQRVINALLAYQTTDTEWLAARDKATVEILEQAIAQCGSSTAPRVAVLRDAIEAKRSK